MGHIVFGAQLMADLVGAEVCHGAQAGETVVGEAAAPHELAHGVVVLLVFQGLPAVSYDRAQESGGDLVGHLISLGVGEIAVQRVHHDVHDAAGHLVAGKGIGELRVHDRKFHAVERRVDAGFAPDLLVGENRGVAHLAAGGGDGEDDAHGKALRERGLFRPDIPELCVRVGRAVGDAFGGVDDAAASDGQDKVSIEIQRLFHAFLGQGEAGIGLHAADLRPGDISRVQLALDSLEQTAAPDAASAVDDQHTAAVPAADSRRCLGLGVLSENDLRGSVVYEILHDGILLLYFLL